MKLITNTLTKYKQKKSCILQLSTNQTGPMQVKHNLYTQKNTSDEKLILINYPLVHPEIFQYSLVV